MIVISDLTESYVQELVAEEMLAVVGGKGTKVVIKIIVKGGDNEFNFYFGGR